MNKGIAVVGGAGLGAALMYFLDPDRGKTRRIKARDKAEAAINKVTDAAVRANRDFRNRAAGVAIETRNLFKQEEVPDTVLVERVRARLGRVCSDIASLNINAQDGVISLEGSIPVNEANRALRLARLVRGVKKVDNSLSVKQRSEPDTQSLPIRELM